MMNPDGKTTVQLNIITPLLSTYRYHKMDSFAGMVDLIVSLTGVKSAHRGVCLPIIMGHFRLLSAL